MGTHITRRQLERIAIGLGLPAALVELRRARGPVRGVTFASLLADVARQAELAIAERQALCPHQFVGTGHCQLCGISDARAAEARAAHEAARADTPESAAEKARGARAALDSLAGILAPER